MSLFDRLGIVRKLLVITLVPTVVSLLLAVALLLSFDAASRQHTLKREATVTASLVGEQLSSYYTGTGVGGGPGWLRPGQAEQTLHTLSRDPRVRAACLYDAEGAVVARYFRDRSVEPLPADAGGAAFPARFSGGRLHVYHRLVAADPARGTVGAIGLLYLRLDAGSLGTHLLTYGAAALFILLLCLAVAVLLSARLHRVISEPLRHLEETARQVSRAEDFSLRAVKAHDDEVGRLADAFNSMLARVEAHDAVLREAHDRLEDRVEERTRALRMEVRERKATTTTLRAEVEAHRRTAERLERAKDEAEEASRFKGEFLAKMSHEIRTPMNGIIGMTELLLGTPLSAAQRKYAETVRRSGRALLKLIGDILDFSKVEAGELVIDAIPFDLQVACEDVIELLTPRAEEKGLTLILRYPPDAPKRLVGDPGRVRQVLTNLVANAVKFTSRGYVLVTIQSARVEGNRALLRVAVEDTGIGLAPEQLETIFGEYKQAGRAVTRRYGGTGLGLAISKQLVELMGGEIGVTSREGVGSRFWFRLEMELDRQETLDHAPADLAGVPILIVDHSALNRQVLAEQVSAWGMHPTVAGAGRTALHVLQQAQAQGRPFRMVLIDDQLPDMQGELLGRRVKGLDGMGDVLLMLQTSLGQRGDAQRVFDLGFSAYLTRPIRQSELMDALSTVWSAHLRGEDLALVTRHTVAERHEQADRRARQPLMKLRACVLVADDNQVNQQVAMEILRDLGCMVALVDNGEEALQRATVESFDLIFMDCQMPVMDGFEATRRLRDAERDGQRTPVIAMTAHAMRGDRERCIAAGMDDYVSKPLDPDAVQRILRLWLPDRAGGAEGKDSPGKERVEMAILDMQQALRVTGGQLDRFQRIAEVYLNHMPTRVTELGQALEAGDREEVCRLAHSVQGASASLGGLRVHQAALRIEEITREDTLEGVSALYAQLQSEFEALQDALRNMRFDDAEEDIQEAQRA